MTIAAGKLRGDALRVTTYWTNWMIDVALDVLLTGLRILTCLRVDVFGAPGTFLKHVSDILKARRLGTLTAADRRSPTFAVT